LQETRPDRIEGLNDVHNKKSRNKSKAAGRKTSKQRESEPMDRNPQPNKKKNRKLKRGEHSSRGCWFEKLKWGTGSGREEKDEQVEKTPRGRPQKRDNAKKGSRMFNVSVIEEYGKGREEKNVWFRGAGSTHTAVGKEKGRLPFWVSDKPENRKFNEIRFAGEKEDGRLGVLGR